MSEPATEPTEPSEPPEPSEPTALPASPDAAVRAAFRSSLPRWSALAAGAWASLLAAAWIALAELDGLVGQVVRDGRTSSMTGLTGPGTLASSVDGARTDWDLLASTLADTPGVRTWVVAYALTDLVLIAAYVGGPGLLLARRIRRHPVGRAWFVAALCLLVLAGVCDVVQSVLLLALARGHEPVAALVGSGRGVWVCLGFALLGVVLGWRQTTDGPRGEDHPTPYAGGAPSSSPTGVVRTVRALYTHRFSLLVVVPFAALGLAHGSDILDQFPDVQRQWVDDGAGRRLVVTGLLTGIVAVVVLVVGRLRSHHVSTRVLPAAAPYRRPSLLPWLVTAAVILVGSWVAERLLSGGEPIAARLWPAVAVPAAVWLLSGVWRVGGGPVPWSPYRQPVTRAQSATTRTVGDVLGVLVVAVPALSLVRSFTAPVALGERGWNVGLLVAGALGALLAWPAALLLARRFGAVAGPTLLTSLTPGLVLEAGAGRRARFSGWVLLGAGVALFVVIGLWPRALVEHLGVIEMVLFAVTAVALPLGATVILLQGGGAPDLLSRPGTTVLRTAPVLSLIVATAVVVGLTGADARVHGLRTLGDDARPSARSTLGERVRSLAAEPGCATPLQGTAHLVRPLFLLAAEGGGIRAAAWTALGVDALQEAGGGCAATVMSSGASGGAVGLTVAAFARPAGGGFRAVEAMARPDALGVAVSGLLVRDPLRSVTGVPFPTSGEAGWVDRAGLMEREWEQVVPGLTAPFLAGDQTRATGALILNSTSVATSCRTLLSQVRLDSDPDARSCTGSSAVPDSVDLLAALRVGCTDTVPTLRASTVGLLASRFPYVTPSGVVTTGCRPGARDPQTQQVVDGGYADNDGLGTVLDLAPQWLPVVRAHNTDVIEGRAPGALIVPVLLYFDNGAGSDLAAADTGSTNELLVPLLTKGGATSGLSSTDTQLHRVQDALGTAAIVPACGASGPSDPTAGPVCAALDAWRGSPAKVFYQPSRPSIAAPLGWVLSGQSLRTLRCARDEQVVGAGVAALAGRACDPAAAIGPTEQTVALASDRCADRAARDRSPLAVKGYGTMLSALCLARAARMAGRG